MSFEQIFYYVCAALAILIWRPWRLLSEGKGRAQLEGSSDCEEPEGMTWKDGDGLHPHEKARLFKALACPDCGDRLAEGPSGGLSVNIYCVNEACGSGFNVCPPIFAERISNRSPKFKLPNAPLPGHNPTSEYR